MSSGEVGGHRKSYPWVVIRAGQNMQKFLAKYANIYAAKTAKICRKYAKYANKSQNMHFHAKKCKCIAYLHAVDSANSIKDL